MFTQPHQRKIFLHPSSHIQNNVRPPKIHFHLSTPIRSNCQTTPNHPKYASTYHHPPTYESTYHHPPVKNVHSPPLIQNIPPFNPNHPQNTFTHSCQPIKNVQKHPQPHKIYLHQFPPTMKNVHPPITSFHQFPPLQ